MAELSDQGQAKAVSRLPRLVLVEVRIQMGRARLQTHLLSSGDGLKPKQAAPRTPTRNALSWESMADHTLDSCRGGGC